MLNRLRTNSLFAIVFSLLLGTPFIGFAQSPIEEIKQEALAAKLTPELLSIQQKGVQKVNDQKSKGLRQAASSEGETTLTQNDEVQMRDGLIAIDAISNGSDAQSLLTSLQALGMVEGQYYQKIVSGYFPVDKLNLLRDVTTLHVARPAAIPVVNAGRTTSQGDRAMRSDVARQAYNVTGAGSKVGILSDSYDALRGAEAGVASDDLPANVQILKDVPSGTDEGRAMAEIVHDVAPGAAIAFHTAFVSYVDFANGIVRLAQAGCNIITDDIAYFVEPFFQDGIVSQAIDYVNKNWNASYFKSAGNYARQSYSSGFRNSGRLPAGAVYPAGSAAHEFANGRLTQRVSIPAGGSFNCILQWSDPYYSESIQSGGVSGAKTDLDLLFYFNGALLFRSINNNIGFDPYERISITNNGSTAAEIEIAIVKRAGPDPEIIKWVNFGSTAAIEFDTRSGTSVGHANAAGAISVGAVRWSQTPEYNPTVYPVPVIETFSSAGGVPILFTEYGQPFPTRIRQKPEISAADGGNTTFFGQAFPGGDGDNFPNFFGTSAAAPHAAGVAALLQEKAKLSMSPADILKRLQSTAIDMDDPLTPGFDVGFDFRTGFGFIQADKALMFGQPLTILEPIYDCQSGRISLQTAGGDGSPISFSLPGVTRTSPTSTTGIVEAGVRNDPKPIVITATQSGVSVTYSFNLVEYCARPRELTLLEPLYECATGRITIRTAGGDGSPITYTIPGVMRSALTDPSGVVEAGLRGDPKPLQITATQSGVSVSYVFNFGAYCSGRAREGAVAEQGSGLQVRVLGNPVVSEWLEVEVQGAVGQRLQLQLSNTLGEQTGSQVVEVAESVERQKISVGRVPGLYFLKVSTAAQSKTIKLIRQQ